MIAWQHLVSVDQLDQIIEQSYQFPVLIFKHSSRCNVSAIAKMRLEDQWSYVEGANKIYFLDILRHRDVSNAVADKFSVYHESPQLLLIRKGDCTYESSHFDIHINDVKEHL